MTTTDPHHLIDFQPIGRRVQVPAGTDLLTAAQLAGVDLLAVCGGMGICGACRVRLVSGELTPLTASEEEALDATQVAQGYRLACQAAPLSDVRLDVPPESLPAGQRLQVEGVAEAQELDPAVKAVDLAVQPPGLHDLRSDFTRVLQGLAGSEVLAQDKPAAPGEPAAPDASMAAHSQLSAALRENDWQVRLALGERPDGAVRQRRYLAGTFARSTALLGLAVDMGSTKLAFYLVDLASGATLATAGVMNPQIAYGEDVVSRIAFANKSEENRRLLQARLVETINQAVIDLCEQANANAPDVVCAQPGDQIVDAVMVGNTAMHHFFCGLPVSQLGASPYVPSVSEPLWVRAEEIGLAFAPGARVYLPPNIAGYVGADHTAALLSSRIYLDGAPRLLVDIGTNTEISLAYNGEMFTCSTASGPAFEGAHIRDGMRAAPGAIDSLRITPAGVQVSTIDGARPVGICGTGILKTVSEMLDASLLDERGMFNRADNRIRVIDRRTEFPLVPAGKSGHGREILVNRKDVNEIQLAKGAIRSGIDILLREAGLGAGDVAQWVIAGAFGTYLDLESAIRIGMFPAAPLERFSQVGNAAGMGARGMLLSRQQREQTLRIVERANYIELTAYPEFTEIFLENMYFRGVESGE